MDGAQKLELAGEADLVLMGPRLAGESGAAIYKKLKATAATRFLPILFVSVVDQAAERKEAAESGADDFLVLPAESVEMLTRVKTLLKLREAHGSLEETHGLMTTLALVIEERERHSGAHGSRVAAGAVEIGREIGLSVTELDWLERGALVHDIGKIGVPDALTMKPSNLNEEEWAIMRSHVTIGEKLGARLSSEKSFLGLIRHHHEQWDGSGYPDRLRGEEIPLFARIVAVSDAYDAMTSDRPYRRRKHDHEARAILAAGADYQWDGKLVDVFLELLKHQEVTLGSRFGAGDLREKR